VTSSDETLKLAERCEQAAGPDRELDAIISATLDGYTAIEERHGGWIVATGKGVMERSLGLIDPGKHSRNFTPQHHDTPAYAASLDAAMTLVPEGMLWTVEQWANGATASVARTRPYESGKRYHAATPALALCAAALRARVSAPTDKGGR
jgi:hypothetical protein